MEADVKPHPPVKSRYLKTSMDIAEVPKMHFSKVHKGLTLKGKIHPRKSQVSQSFDFSS